MTNECLKRYSASLARREMQMEIFFFFFFFFLANGNLDEINYMPIRTALIEIIDRTQR